MQRIEFDDLQFHITDLFAGEIALPNRLINLLLSTVIAIVALAIIDYESAFADFCSNGNWKLNCYETGINHLTGAAENCTGIRRWARSASIASPATGRDSRKPWAR